jgi:hypothetical protein
MASLLVSDYSCSVSGVFVTLVLLGRGAKSTFRGLLDPEEEEEDAVISLDVGSHLPPDLA